MFARVIIDIPHSKVDRQFEYALPEGLFVPVGMRVMVPFGNGSKKMQGYVVALTDRVDYDISKIKPILSTIDEFPVLTSEQITLAEHIAREQHITMCSVLRAMFPSELRRGEVKAKTKKILSLNKECIHTIKKTPNTLKLLDCFENSPQIEYLSLPENLRATAKRGIASGWICGTIKEDFRNPVSLAGEGVHIQLTAQQEHCLNSVDMDNDQGYLLFGVTGSGKTEVYAKLINKVLENGKTAVLMVPEISLTPQLLHMIKSRVHAQVAVLHSGLSSGERYDEWRRIALGEAKVVVGARSAVFAPLSNIGIMIIDEEHELSYKSEQTPKYLTHDIVQKRCEMWNCPYIFGSATPSIESFHSARKGELKLLTLKNRINDLPLPQIIVADMREELALGNRTMFSAELYDQLRQTLNMGKQAMLFINRRGHSNFVMCRGCGYTEYCDSCSVTMTYHSKSNLLKCHYCGRTKQVTKICPQCTKPYLKHFGIGTQRVEEEVLKEFPGVRVIRMDFDTVRKKDSHLKIYSDFANNRADILIGTQMIAKGFNFDNLRLVGVIAADMSLKVPDYRSSFRTYSLLEQVSGRAGRKGEGVVVVQTYNPQHFSILRAKNHDYIGFYEEEIVSRQACCLPPFGTFYRILFSGEDEQKLVLSATDLYNKLKIGLKPYYNEIFIFTHGYSPVAKIDNKIRYQILLKTGVNRAMHRQLLDTLDHSEYDVLVNFEVNPSSMF